MRPLKKTKRIAPADAGAFFEEAEKPCASGKIFCVKNGGSACYFGAAVLIYKYHSNVPGRVVCFGKAGKVFSTEYADRGAGLMRTRNNGQAAGAGRGGRAEGAAACRGGVSGAGGGGRAAGHRGGPKVPPPAWAELLGRGRISCGLSQNLWSAIQTHLPAEVASGCPVRSLRTGLFVSLSLCPCVGAEGLRQNTGGGTV